MSVCVRKRVCVRVRVSACARVTVSRWQPRFGEGGKLREMVRASFATFVMNYEDMVAAGEARSAVLKLQAATRQHWGQDSESAHSTLVSWGKLIREKFDQDNLPLFMYNTPEAKPILELLLKMDAKMDARCYFWLCLCICACLCLYLYRL